VTLTGAQVRAARTLLDWPQHRMADELRVRLSEYAGFEAGKSQLSVLQTSVLKRVLEQAGVGFEDNGRVRLREGKAQ
jgi:transcriptional regulator with XRE-family HTH domain